MKKLTMTAVAAITILALGGAMAAPQDAAIAAAQKTPAAQPVATADAAVAAPTLKKYPLDHGPRAEVTPWVNQQRRSQDRQDAQLAAAHRDSDQHAGTN